MNVRGVWVGLFFLVLSGAHAAGEGILRHLGIERDAGRYREARQNLRAEFKRRIPQPKARRKGKPIPGRRNSEGYLRFSSLTRSSNPEPLSATSVNHRARARAVGTVHAFSSLAVGW